MGRQVKERAKTDPQWVDLRPTVTKALLADITRRIVEKFNPYKVILFGSYAYGKPQLYSDIDLLVVMDSKQRMPQRIRRVSKAAEVKFLPMDIIVRTPAEMAQRLAMGDFLLIGILTKGKVLYQREPS